MSTLLRDGRTKTTTTHCSIWNGRRDVCELYELVVVGR